MRKLLLVILSMLLIACGTQVIETQEEEDRNLTNGDTDLEVYDNVQVITHTLIVRSGPNPKASQVDEVYLGSVYRVTGESYTTEDGLWYEIEYDDNVTGWVLGDDCQPTVFEPFEYDQGQCLELALPTHCYINHVLTPDLIIDDQAYDLFVDHIKVEDTYTLQQRGIYQVYGVSKENPDQKTLVYTVEVVSNYIYGLVYEAYDRESSVIGAVMGRGDIEGAVIAAYLTVEDDYEIWYEMDYEGQRAYVDGTNKDPVQGIDTVHCILTNGKETLQGNNLVPGARLFQNRYYQVFDGGTTFINPQDGAKYHLDEDYDLIDDGKAMLVYDKYSAFDFEYTYEVNQTFENQTFHLQLIDLEAGNFDVIVDFEKSCLFIDPTYTDMTSETRRYFIFNNISDHDWVYASDRFMKEVYVLSKDHGQWTMSLVDSPYLDYEEEGFQVYETFLDLTSAIGQYRPSECKTLTFMNVYDIIDGHYVLWFQVTLMDGRQGYAYRKLRDKEDAYMLTHVETLLVLADGSFYTLEAQNEYLFMGRILTRGLESLETYIVTTELEGNGNTLVSKDPRTEPVDLWNTSFYSTPDQRWLITIAYFYVNAYGNQFTIYDLSGGNMEEVYSMAFEERWFRSLNIVDNETISFFITDYEEKHPVILKHIHGQWQVVNVLEIE